MNSLNKITEYQNNVASFNVGAVPEVLTEDELVQFLRIPEVSTAKDYHNVILNLIRMRHLPRIKIGKKRLFPRKAILEWIESETIKNKALTDEYEADINEEHNNYFKYTGK